MRYFKFVMLATFILVVLTAGAVIAQDDRYSFRYFSDYIYFSDEEMTEFNEIIWFWQTDILDGPMHTNSSFGIKNTPTFLGPVTTSASSYYEMNANALFTYEPIIDWPIALFPTELQELEAEAVSQGTAFENTGDSHQFRCIGDENNWDWYKWPANVPFSPEVIIDQGQIPYGTDLAIYFDGSLEISSEYVTGTGTIGCRDTLKIIDNLKYEDVDYNTITIPEDSENKYGYICNGDIMIMNTEANGRGNGINANGGHDSAHVVLTGSFFAMDEMFTIENQNDDWEDWVWCRDEQPGIPDERGTIYIHGSLANKRRGYIHRSNCGGTGYGKSYNYDYRLMGSPPPHFPEIEWDGNIVVKPETLEETEIALAVDERIIVAGRGHLSLGENSTITKEYALNERPYVIKSYFGGGVSVDATTDEPASIVVNNATNEIVDVFATDGVYDWGIGTIQDDVWTGFFVSGDNLTLPALDEIDGCEFSGNNIEFVPLQANAATSRVIRNSFLIGDIVLAPDNPALMGYELIEKCVIKGEVNGRINNVDRCNFLPNEGSRPALLTTNELTEVRNTFFKSEEQTVLLSSNVSVDYSAYNTGDFHPPFSTGATIGSNMLHEVDPMFVDYENGDYHLLEDSPLIDAGDPESTMDPDNTVADIGTYYYHQTSVNDDDNSLPKEFSLGEVWPNPFNGMASVSFKLPQKSEVSISIVDILGREIFSDKSRVYTAGSHTLTFDLTEFSSGTYFLNFIHQNSIETRKLLMIK